MFCQSRRRLFAICFVATMKQLDCLKVTILNWKQTAVCAIFFDCYDRAMTSVHLLRSKLSSRICELLWLSKRRADAAVHGNFVCAQSNRLTFAPKSQDFTFTTEFRVRFKYLNFSKRNFLFLFFLFTTHSLDVCDDRSACETLLNWIFVCARSMFLRSVFGSLSRLCKARDTGKWKAAHGSIGALSVGNSVECFSPRLCLFERCYNFSGNCLIHSSFMRNSKPAMELCLGFRECKPETVIRNLFTSDKFMLRSRWQAYTSALPFATSMYLRGSSNITTTQIARQLLRYEWWREQSNNNEWGPKERIREKDIWWANT